MSFPRYPTYKDSGVEWLGDVPAHWDTLRLSTLARAERSSFIDGDWIEAPYITDDGIRLIQTGNVGIGVYKEQGFRFITPDTFVELGCTEVSPGDVLICRLAEPVGRACLAPDLGTKMITSVDVCILKPRPDISPQFVVYMLSSVQYLGFMEGQCRGGTRDRVSRSFLGSVRVALPKLQEQRLITAFLDRETAKLDALMAEQQRLIELLKEKRQAVISHAVTKGLNPNVPMKPSGVEWLGEVPAHWEVKELRRFSCMVQSGPFGSQLHAEEYVSQGIPVINPINLVDGVIIPSDDVTVTPSVVERLSHQKLQVGDVVFSRRGELGRCALVSEVERGWLCGTGSMILRLYDSKHDPRYLSRYLSLDATRHYFESYSIGAIMDSLSSSTLLGLSMLVPPPEEQVAIIGFVEVEARRLDALTSEAQRAIDLLQERRAALISAAVTGQIDVRAIANRSAA